MSELDQLRKRVSFLEWKLWQMAAQGKASGSWWTRRSRELETARDRLKRLERHLYVPRGWRDRGEP